jgi:predicted nuclease with TOPRIM domain
MTPEEELQALRKQLEDNNFHNAQTNRSVNESTAQKNAEIQKRIDEIVAEQKRAKEKNPKTRWDASDLRKKIDEDNSGK